jgi:hypothetical protein
MFRLTNFYASVLIIILLCISVFAKLAGKGEITGRVFQSWTSGEKVGFRLNISEQKNVEGPTIASGNNFVYGGAERLEITEGDVVRILYNSSDADGIIVEKLEFIENKPGAIGQTRNLTLIIAALGVLFGIVLIVGAIVYKNRRNREQNV